MEWNVRPPDGGVCADKVVLYDGPSVTDPVIGEYCGPEFPDVTSMTSQHILVVFQSVQYYYAWDGKFRVKFTAINVTGMLTCMVMYKFTAINVTGMLTCMVMYKFTAINVTGMLTCMVMYKFTAINVTGMLTCMVMYKFTAM